MPKEKSRNWNLGLPDSKRAGVTLMAFLACPFPLTMALWGFWAISVLYIKESGESGVEWVPSLKISLVSPAPSGPQFSQL